VNIVELLTQREFMIGVLAAISAAAMVFTFGSSLIVKQDMRQRIKRVAVERDQLRAAEMARLRGGTVTDVRSSVRGTDTKAYMKRAVDRFDLKRAFQDESTVEKLAMAGYRGQGHLTTFLFQRLAAPLGVFAIAAFYLLVVMPGDRPVYLNVTYAIGAGIVGAYLPVLMLKNATQKRQASIRRAGLSRPSAAVRRGWHVDGTCVQARGQGSGPAKPGAG
jgi:tight adherence protein C